MATDHQGTHSPAALQTAERLRELSRQGADALAQVIEYLPVGVFVGDLSGITLCNRLGLEMLGFASLDEMRREVVELAERLQSRRLDTGEPIKPDNDPFVAALRGQPATAEIVYRHVATGREAVMRCTAVPVFEDGKVARAIAITADVTDLVHAERESRRAHERLAEARAERERTVALFDTLLDAAPLGFAFIDREGRYRLVNERLAQMNGVPAAGHLGRTVREVVPDIADAIEEVLARMRATGEPLVDFEVAGETPAAPGRRRVWLENWYPVPGADGQPAGFGVLVSEVTERTAMERALRESEERFRATFEHAAVGLAHVALDGSWMRVNQRLCEIVGYDRDDLMGRTFQDITHPDDLEADLAQARRLTAGEIDTYSMEKRYIRKDGSVVWVELTGSVVRDEKGDIEYFIAAVADIDARKRAEAALRESEERFRTLADNISQLAWMADADGERFWYNRRWYEYTGTTPDEMKEWGWQKVHHPDHRERVNEKYRRHIARGEEWEDTFPLRGADGNYRWFLSRAQPIRDERGEVVRWFGTNTDVTEQREAEIEREELLAKRSRVAETLQRSLLLVPPPDTFPGVTVKPLYQPASDDALVGGDFYDIFAVAEDRVALVIGDVTGKGLEAATYTAEVKFALRAFLREHPEPAAAFARLNRFIRSAMRFDTEHLGAAYVVAAVVVIDTRTGELVGATAGMEPPFVLRAATRDVVELTAGGPILGVEDDMTYGTQRERLAPGDLLAMSTDGITEARRGVRFFGYEGLVDTVREHAHLPSLAGIGDAVVERATAFAGNRQQDDICLLLVRRREDVPA